MSETEQQPYGLSDQAIKSGLELANQFVNIGQLKDKPQVMRDVLSRLENYTHSGKIMDNSTLLTEHGFRQFEDKFAKGVVEAYFKSHPTPHMVEVFETEARYQKWLDQAHSENTVLRESNANLEKNLNNATSIAQTYATSNADISRTVDRQSATLNYLWPTIMVETAILSILAIRAWKNRIAKRQGNRPQI